jgi:Uncharacterized protein involved in tolerance to divalent cations
MGSKSGLMKILRIETTFPNREEANKFVERLLSQKLVACAQFCSIDSAYWWNNSIERSNEILVILKLSRENLNEVLSKFEDHPYKIPEISITEIKTTRDYGDWVNNIKGP